MKLSTSWRIPFSLIVVFFFSQFTSDAQSPGNVSTSLELWLKANTGVTGSSPVTSWADQSGNVLDATAVNSPTLITDALNFNPTINFDGTSARFTTGSLALFSTNTSPVSIIVVFDTDASGGEKFLLMQDQTSGTDNVELGYDIGAGSGSGNFGYGVGGTDATIAASGTISDNTFTIMSSLILNSGTAPANVNIFRNGENLTPSNDNNGFMDAGGYNTASAILNIGARNTGTPDGFHDGDIAELIVYTQQLSASDRQQIESYLAIKYGITIDQTSATDYLASDGGVIWNGTTNASYNTDITGIGRDDNSALDQQKSSSINANAILTIANGDITTPASFSSNDAFLIWGSDNAATTFGTDNINNADGTTSDRMNRVWKVQETGTVGNVEIAFSNGLATGTVSIVIDPSDNTFANNANRRVVEMTDSGSDYEVTVDLNDGDFFSFVNASASAITTKPVLINEIITEAQQDWGSGNFYNASPGGTAGTDGTDEWIELYIATGGLDLSSWTIELNDGSDVSGDLSSSGAFEVSNYLSTAGGSITNTVAGDYLILGNVAGSGAMNSTGLTVNLRNASSAIIDQVLVGSGAPSGNSNDTSDESVSRIPGESDTNDNSTDFSLTRATLGTTNSPSGIVIINEVVTDPQQDWSSIGFNGSPPGGSGADDDEWIELYIGTAGINLTGWTMQITDGTDVSGELTTGSGGVFNIVNYVTGGSGSFINTEVGDYLVLGDPTGTMNNDVLLILEDASGSEIDRVKLGGAVSEAPSGNASSASNESISRYTNATDTDADDADFIQTIATLGGTNSLSGTVLINEVVTSPQQDWSTNGFDGTVAGGTVSDVDEWVELYIGTTGMNLTNWTIELTDGSNDTGDLTASGAFQTSNYISNTVGSSFLSTAAGDYLVLGNVVSTGSMEDDILITLRDATGILIDEVELGDDPASDGNGDGAPDGSADGGLSVGISDESIARLPNATDTDNDVADFSETPASLGTINSLTPLPGPGNALPFTDVDHVLINDDATLEMTGDFTIEFWLNTTETGNNIILEKGTSNSEYSIQQFSGDVIGLNVNGTMSTNGSYNDGNWHHVAVVYRGSNDGTIYVDGIDDTNGTNTLGTPSFSTGDLSIGTRVGDGSLSIEGTIDEVRIWDDERSHEEVLENMFSTLDGTETDLVSYYNFDQSSGTSLSDIAASNDGTLTNMAGSEWTSAGWDTFAENQAIFQSGGLDTSTGTSGELTLTDVAFLNDDNDLLLAGHDNNTFGEVTTDLPSGTLLTARYARTWHMTKNDASGTTDGNVTLSFDIGATPNASVTYYLLERASTSGDFSIVPVIGVNPSGNNVVFTLNTSQIDDGSYYTLGRSDANVGNSLDFDGSVDYVSIADDDVFSFGDGSNDSPFSVETWVYFDATASQGIVSKRAGFDEWHMALSGSGQLSITLADNSASAFLFGETSGLTLNTGQWYHMAFTYDASETAAGISLYIDGVQLTNNSSSIGSYTAMENTTSAVEIGTINSSASFDLDGQVDELRIWNDIRTHDEIVTNMFTNLAGDEANLVGYYRFNQGIGNSDSNLPDLSGDNNNGSLNGFANLGGVSAPSNYVTSTRTTFNSIALIVNGGSLTGASDELTITSTQTAGDFLQDAGDQIFWGNDGGAFSETTSDLPASTLVSSRITKTWFVDKEDIVGTAHGNLTFTFDFGSSPNADYTYYLLKRSSTSGDFEVTEIMGTTISGNNISIVVDASQIDDTYYFTLGRSGIGPGNAIDFDGTNDYVSIADDAQLQLTSNMTIEAWIRPESNGTQGIVSKKTSGLSNPGYVLYLVTSGSDAQVTFQTQNVTASPMASTGLVSTNEWAHVAVVVGASTAIYINGQEQPMLVAVSSLASSTDPLIIAAIDNSVTSPFNGQIDEVRIWGDARTTDEIQQNMHRTLDVTDAGNDNLVAYYDFNEGIPGGNNSSPMVDQLPDHSGNNHTGTLTNIGLTSTTSNWVDSDGVISDQNSAQSLIGPGNALDFDGSDDYVLVSDASSLDITGNLTLEAWINLTTTPPSANEGIVAKFLNAGNQESYALNITTGGGNVEFIITSDGSTDETLTSTSAISTGVWTHIAAVFTPNTSLEIYINGILDNSAATSLATIHSGTADLWIGASSILGANNQINGIIDEVRIWNVARSATNIQDNMYEELTGSETGLVAYYRLDEISNTGTAADATVNSNTGTLTNMSAANDWVDATAREPFKTTGSGTWSVTDTWKSGVAPNNASTADLNLSHNVVLDGDNSVNDLNINSGVTLTLNASQTLTVAGNLINNGTIAGNGTILFDTGTPMVTGGTYGNVTVNGGTPTLTGNTTITGTLTMTSGNVVLGDFNLTINSGGSISGASSSSYVQTLNQNSSGGALQMEVANGAGVVEFPVGTSTYTPFSMINLGTTGDFTVRVFDDVYTNGTSGALLSTDLEIDKTWDVNALGSGYNTTITIQWNSGDEASFFTRGTMYLSINDATGLWGRITGDISASGGDPYTASASGITSFSQVGGGSGTSLLPITLIEFDATSMPNGIMLDWKTATEINNQGFEIERSIDGQIFERIGSVNGAGTSNEANNYEFMDYSPNAGKNFYRLKQVDFDGSFEYSPIVSVQFEQLGELFVVYPNPFSDDLLINISPQVKGDIEINLYNLTGELLQNTMIESANIAVFSNLNLRSGIYFLELNYNGSISRIKLVKE